MVLSIYSHRYPHIFDNERDLNILIGPIALDIKAMNSLWPGRFKSNLRYIIFKLILVIDAWGISCRLVLVWMPLAFADDQSTLVQVMAWCLRATSHYLSQCWSRFLSPYGVTRPQWVNGGNEILGHKLRATLKLNKILIIVEYSTNRLHDMCDWSSEESNMKSVVSGLLTSFLSWISNNMTNKVWGDVVFKTATNLLRYLTSNSVTVGINHNIHVDLIKIEFPVLSTRR